MQVSLENIASLERRMTVSLPAERLDGVVGKRLQEIARTAKLKGFRPGTDPAKVIEQRYGPQVRDEAMGELIRQTFDEAVRQEKLQPAGNPDIKAEPKDESGEIRYTATFEVVPDFGPIDVTTLKFDRVVSSVEDADIDAMLETLRQQRQAWHPVTRPAQAGDLVRVETFAMIGAERSPAEGVEQGATVIGSNAMLPELEAQLIGMSAGEEREAEVTFPGELADAEPGRPDSPRSPSRSPRSPSPSFRKSTKPSSRASACAAASWKSSARKSAPTSSAS